MPVATRPIWEHTGQDVTAEQIARRLDEVTA